MDMSDAEGGSIERTLVLLKPDAIARGLIGRITQRFEDALLKVVGAKMVLMDAGFARQHYFDLEERLGSGVYSLTAAFMQKGPVLALVLEGVDAVKTVRKIVGPTYPNEAAPGTVRGDFAHQSRAYAIGHDLPVANLVHASGNVEEAKREVELWFTPAELFSYRAVADAYVV
jgi:nucleoside-diphosphate kinase